MNWLEYYHIWMCPTLLRMLRPFSFVREASDFRPEASGPKRDFRTRPTFGGYTQDETARNRQTRTSPEINSDGVGRGRIWSAGSDASRTKLKGRNIPLRVGIASVQRVQIRWEVGGCWVAAKHCNHIKFT